MEKEATRIPSLILLTMIAKFPLLFYDLVATATKTVSLTFRVILITYEWLSRLHLMGDKELTSII